MVIEMTYPNDHNIGSGGNWLRRWLMTPESIIEVTYPDDWGIGMTRNRYPNA
jgi:hypothetical protein